MTKYEETKNMLTTSQVARLFNVHAATVRRWSRQGILKAYIVGSHAEKRFRRDDVAILFLEKAVNKHEED
ncbi:helix-turn-helix domain-containing protein [Chloroflexota bacterium]